MSCKNPRRYFRLNVSLPIRVYPHYETGSFSHLSKFDFPFTPIHYFTHEKNAWLNEKVLEYRRAIDTAIQNNPDIRYPFERLSEKVVFLEDVVHSLVESYNPLKHEEGKLFRHKIMTHAEPIDTSLLSVSSPRTANIIQAFDDKVNHFLNILFLVMELSSNKSLHTAYMPTGWRIDHLMSDLRPKVNKAPLAKAFVGIYDYLEELIGLFSFVMRLHDATTLHQDRRQVNLSQGGVSLCLPYNFDSRKQVRVQMLLDLERCPALEKFVPDNDTYPDEFRKVELGGSVVQQVFDPKIGEWRVSINFDLMPTRDFDRLSAFLKQAEVREAIGSAV